MPNSIIEPFYSTYEANSYAHTIIVYASEQTQNNNFEGYVYTDLQFALGTKDLSSNNKTKSNIVSISLPSPNANSFVTANNLTKEIITNWIKENYDIGSLENDNIQKLES